MIRVQNILMLNLEVNAAGRKLGKEHPNEDSEVIIRKPNRMPPGF